VKRVYVCHYCQGCGEVEQQQGDGRPWGWYTLSVNVPAWMGKAGKPYLWVGMWCSAACLAADMPTLIGQEQLARLAYEVDLPEHSS
jgi:hypothetical protein